jgi:hypothetical protein
MQAKMEAKAKAAAEAEAEVGILEYLPYICHVHMLEGGGGRYSRIFTVYLPCTYARRRRRSVF